MNNSNFASEVSKKGFINHIGGIDFKKVSENSFEFSAIVKNYKKWSEKSNIITKFAVVRLKYDNSEQLIMKLNNISLNVK